MNFRVMDDGWPGPQNPPQSEALSSDRGVLAASSWDDGRGEIHESQRLGTPVLSKVIKAQYSNFFAIEKANC